MITLFFCLFSMYLFSGWLSERLEGVEEGRGKKKKKKKKLFSFFVLTR